MQHSFQCVLHGFQCRCSCWSTSRSSSRMLATGSPPNEWFQVNLLFKLFPMCLFWCLLEDICPGSDVYILLYILLFVFLMLVYLYLNEYYWIVCILGRHTHTIHAEDDCNSLYEQFFTWPGTGICNIYEFLAYKHPHEVDEEAWRALNDTRASSMALFLAHCWQPSWWSRVVVVAVVVIVVTLLSFFLSWLYCCCFCCFNLGPSGACVAQWAPQGASDAWCSEVLISPNATRVYSVT